MTQDLLDLYSDYLLCSFGQATATGLGEVVEGSVSHDQITRSLSGKGRGGAELWQVAKRFVRQIQSEDGVLILDDTISEKPHSDENDIVCWHYPTGTFRDHTSGSVIKGINLMTALYHVSSRALSLPVEFRLIAKTEVYVDKKDGKTKRRSPITKNEYYRMMAQQAVINRIPFKYVLNDIWKPPSVGGLPRPTI